MKKVLEQGPRKAVAQDGMHGVVGFLSFLGPGYNLE